MAGRVAGMTCKRWGRAVALVGILSGLALTMTPAEAQYGTPPWAYGYGYYRGYPPPPGPPGNEGPFGGRYGYYAQRTFTVADIHRHVSRMGLRLIAKPRRKDDIFLAEAEDSNGAVHRLVFGAKSGRLLENTKLTTHKETAPPSSANPQSPNPQ